MRMEAGSRRARPAARATRSRTLANRTRRAAESTTYFLMLDSTDLATAAFGPSGASFR